MDNDFIEKKNEFYEVFFTKILQKFVDFLSFKLSNGQPEFKVNFINSKQIIIEILCHCLKQQGQRMRYYTIQNNLLIRIMDLVNDESKVINLMIVKFVKTVVFNNV